MTNHKFTVILLAREGADCISEEGLRNFYQKFAGLKGVELDMTTMQGFKTATAVSRHSICVQP